MRKREQSKEDSRLDNLSIEELVRLERQYGIELPISTPTKCQLLKYHEGQINFLASISSISKAKSSVYKLGTHSKPESHADWLSSDSSDESDTLGKRVTEFKLSH